MNCTWTSDKSAGRILQLLAETTFEKFPFAVYHFLRICLNLQTDMYSVKNKKIVANNEAQMISKCKTINNLNRNHYVQSRYEHIKKKKQSIKWQGVVRRQP